MTLELRQESAITVEEIKDDISGNFAGRDDLTEATIYRYMTMAQNRIAGRIDWQDMYTNFQIADEAEGIDADRIIQLDDSKSQLNTVFNSTHRRIRGIHTIHIIPTVGGVANDRMKLKKVQTAKQWFGDIALRFSTTPTQPTNYFWWQHDRIQVFPTPEQNYTLDLFVSLYPAAVGAANPSVMLEVVGAEMAVQSLATSWLAARFKLEDLSSLWAQQHSQAINELLVDENDESDQDMAAIRQESSVQPVGEYWKDPFSAMPNSGEQVI